MTHNLTETQRSILTWMVGEVRAGNLPESFSFWVLPTGAFFAPIYQHVTPPPNGLSRGSLSALARSQFIELSLGKDSYFGCTLLQKAYDAVDSDFSESKGDLNEKRLRSLLAHKDFFSLDELKNLAVQLGFDYEDIAGGTKEAYARELVLYVKRHGSLWELVEVIFRAP